MYVDFLAAFGCHRGKNGAGLDEPLADPSALLCTGETFSSVRGGETRAQCSLSSYVRVCKEVLILQSAKVD